MIKAPRGTVDISPEEMKIWSFIEREIRSKMNIFSFNEVRTPIFEHTELFKRGVGEQTDIVTKEMYNFYDKGGRKLTLKPEGTASVVRFYVEKKYYGIKKLDKMFYISPMFRYERPQAGRYRQHHQFGVEALGSESPLVDAEIISLAISFYKGVGLENLELKLNSVGCPECRPGYLKELKSFLEQGGDQLCEECRVRMAKNTLRVLDCKNPGCRSFLTGAPKITEYLCEECDLHFEELKRALTSVGIGYTLDPYLVRGLDYYTKTTFEIVAVGIGAQDSIAGGGRYDGLVEMLGGPATPAVGFGAGIERLIATMKKFGVEPPEEPARGVFFVFLDETARNAGLPLMYECRAQGIQCDMDYFGRSMKAQMKAANKGGIRCVVIMGEDELAQGRALVRDFETKDQKQVAFSELPQYIMKEYY
jgi:histidyl-tRNA synthetase